MKGFAGKAKDLKNEGPKRVSDRNKHSKKRLGPKQAEGPILQNSIFDKTLFIVPSEQGPLGALPENHKAQDHKGQRERDAKGKEIR